MLYLALSAPNLSHFFLFNFGPQKVVIGVQGVPGVFPGTFGARPRGTPLPGAVIHFGKTSQSTQGATRSKPRYAPKATEGGGSLKINVGPEHTEKKMFHRKNGVSSKGSQQKGVSMKN